MVSKIIFKSKPMIRTPFLMSKVDDPVKCSAKLSKIMYVIATIYKILGVTETDFTYRDGANTHLIVRMADY